MPKSTTQKEGRETFGGCRKGVYRKEGSTKRQSSGESCGSAPKSPGVKVELWVSWTGPRRGSNRAEVGFLVKRSKSRGQGGGGDKTIMRERQGG